MLGNAQFNKTDSCAKEHEEKFLWECSPDKSFPNWLSSCSSLSLGPPWRRGEIRWGQLLPEPDQSHSLASPPTPPSPPPSPAAVGQTSKRRKARRKASTKGVRVGNTANVEGALIGWRTKKRYNLFPEGCDNENVNYLTSPSIKEPRQGSATALGLRFR